MSSEFSIGDITLKVSPEQMFQASDGILTKINSVIGMLDTISSTMNKTSSYWCGRVGECERKHFENENTNTEVIINNFKIYAEKLKNMASNYIETESSASDSAQELPTDIFD